MPPGFFIPANRHRLDLLFPATLAQDHKSFSRSGRISDASRLPPRDARRSFPAPRRSDLSSALGDPNMATNPNLIDLTQQLIDAKPRSMTQPTCSKVG